MHDDPYKPFTYRAKVYPAKSAGWRATEGAVKDANALGITLEYENPVNRRYTTTATFPLASIDRIEWLSADPFAEMKEHREAKAEFEADFDAALAEVRRENLEEAFAIASEELAERQGKHTWRGITEQEDAA